MRNRDFQAFSITARAALLLLLLLPLAEARPRYYQARLLTPLSSHSLIGERFSAQIVGPLSRRQPGWLPPGARLTGAVVDARSVGIGIRRERALLEVRFDDCLLPSGVPTPCQAELVGVDNARESMAGNRLLGIVAARHAHGLVGGLWLRPRVSSFARAPFGLTGVGGWLMVSPIVAPAIVGGRMALLRLPEPEIRLPAGVDLIIRITHDPLPVQAPVSRLEPKLAAALQTVPVEVDHGHGRRAADLINFAFPGSRQQLEAAFAAAGWTTADPLTPRTFARSYRALASMGSYPTAPVSPLIYQGKLPDLVFQRTFNDLGKRHHIRLWQTEILGETYWLGAATHDVSIAFDWNRISLTHRIDPYIDRERNIIWNDLHLAGCIEYAETIERPQHQARSRRQITDGALAWIRLQTCSLSPPATPADDAVVVTRRSATVRHRLLRRTVLEARHYALRGNPYYYAARAIRRGLSPSTAFLPEE